MALKVVIQRVFDASVSVAEEVIGEIAEGLVVFVGIAPTDDSKVADWMVEKLLNLRIFSDDNGKMNHSVVDIQGGILLISQFTLYGDCMKGARPSFIQAAAPKEAEKLYDYMLSRLHSLHPFVAPGQFAAKMDVALRNNGPVTLLIEREKKG